MTCEIMNCECVTYADSIIAIAISSMVVGVVWALAWRTK